MLSKDVVVKVFLCCVPPLAQNAWFIFDFPTLKCTFGSLNAHISPMTSNVVAYAVSSCDVAFCCSNVAASYLLLAALSPATTCSI